MSTPSLDTLPIELLHRILDYVDTETVFLSFRIVCKYFYTIINSYNQYKLDFRSITKSTFDQLRHLIQPKNVVSLILSDDLRTMDQIKLFLSLFDIHTFTRLRSLTLLQIDTTDLTVYLKHISTCPLVSLTIAMRRSLSTVTTFETIQLLKHCPIRHLKLTQRHSLLEIINTLSYFSSLETLLLDGSIKPDAETGPTDLPVIKSNLKSLTFDFCSMDANTIVSILSCTPSLTHLKLTRYPISLVLAWDGYWWAELIQNSLPQLQSFEFFFEKRIDSREPTYDIESVIISFRTSLWLERRWHVVCDYYQDTHILNLYSVPICKSTLIYRPTANKISCSNSTNEIPWIMDNIDSLVLNSIPATFDIGDRNLQSIHPLFPRAAKLSFSIAKNFSDNSIAYLSSLVDLSRVHTLSLTLDLREESLSAIRRDLNNLFDRTCSLQTIHLQSTRADKITNYMRIICPIILKLVRNPTSDIDDGSEVSRIVDQLEDNSSLELQSKGNYRSFFDEKFDGIMKKLTENIKDFSYYSGILCVSFWFGKRKAK